MKILVMGHARHGKDTFCEMLNDLGIPFESATNISLEHAIWPMLNKFYDSKESCFQDRVNHRPLWFTLISYYNTPDKSKLCKKVLENGDIYCGMRKRDEFESCKHLFSHIVWVGAEDRLPPESEESFELNIDDATVVVDNNGSLEDLCQQAREFVSYYKGISC